MLESSRHKTHRHIYSSPMDRHNKLSYSKDPKQRKLHLIRGTSLTFLHIHNQNMIHQNRLGSIRFHRYNKQWYQLRQSRRC